MTSRREILKYLGLQGLVMTAGLGLSFETLAQVIAPRAKGLADAPQAGNNMMPPPAPGANPSTNPQLIPATQPSHRRVVIFIMQRGAMDGLSLLAPIGDPNYAGLRPNIRLDDKGERPALRLDGFFSLHPDAAPLAKYWQGKTLAMIHQCGSPDGSRSHFDAQDFLETGTPGLRATADGFLNRSMMQLEPTGQSGLHAVALQASMPRSLQGAYPAISMLSTNDFNLKGATTMSSAKGFEDMYEGATDKVFRQAGTDTFSNLQTVNKLREKDRSATGKIEYPKSGLSQRLKNIASLIKADLGLRVAVTEIGGWDTHVNQGANNGQLGNRIKELSESIDAFIEDLGPLYHDVVIVTQTEFGRTVKENGTRGTDHGHGSVMMVLGGAIQGGKVLGSWKEMKNENLYEGRDLPVVTDARHIWSEIFSRHLQIGAPAQGHNLIFPGFQTTAQNWLNLLRA